MVFTPAGEVSVTAQAACCAPPLLGSLEAMTKLGSLSDKGERYQEKVWREGQTEGEDGSTTLLPWLHRQGQVPVTAVVASGE